MDCATDQPVQIECKSGYQYMGNHEEQWLHFDGKQWNLDTFGLCDCTNLI